MGSIDDRTFAVKTVSDSNSVKGSLNLPLVNVGQEFGQVVECRVMGVSTMGGVTAKAKLIGEYLVESEF